MMRTSLSSTRLTSLKFALMADGLWDIVNGEEDFDADKDREALSLIGRSVVGKQSSIVQTSTTSRMAWTRLKSLHREAVAANAIYLKRQLCSIELEEGEAVLLYISRAQVMQADLNDAGENISDKTVLDAILSGLPRAKYGCVVDSIICHRLFFEGRDLTLEDVTFLLLKIECELKVHKAKAEQERTRVDKAAKGSRKIAAVTCQKCGERGHKSRSCPNCAVL